MILLSAFLVVSFGADLAATAGHGVLDGDYVSIYRGWQLLRVFFFGINILSVGI